jgi:hypothetical protein
MSMVDGEVLALVVLQQPSGRIVIGLFERNSLSSGISLRAGHGYVIMPRMKPLIDS